MSDINWGSDTGYYDQPDNKDSQTLPFTLPLSSWGVPTWGRSTIIIPMGNGTFSTVDTSRQELPDLVPVPPVGYAIPLPPPIDRRDIPLSDGVVPPIDGATSVTISWNEWLSSGHALPADWAQYTMASGHPLIQAAMQSLPQQGDDNVSWFDDLYDFVDTSLGGWLPGGVPPGGSAPPTYTPPAVLPGVPPPIAPFPTIITGNQPVTIDQSCSGAAPVYKKVCGVYKWVYPKRRRRKSLVTKGDIKGLAALKGVLGNGKAMETWIATHS